jgi:hypothetical protein
MEKHMKNRLFLGTLSIILLALNVDVQAGKTGAALGGLAGGMFLGSALSRPRETVVVREPAPAPVIVTSSGSSAVRQENRELKEDNRYLETENRTLNNEVDSLDRENEQLALENEQLRQENRKLKQELAVLKQPAKQ